MKVTVLRIEDVVADVETHYLRDQVGCLPERWRQAVMPMLRGRMRGIGLGLFPRICQGLDAELERFQVAESRIRHLPFGREDFVEILADYRSFVMAEPSDFWNGKCKEQGVDWLACARVLVKEWRKGVEEKLRQLKLHLLQEVVRRLDAELADYFKSLQVLAKRRFFFEECFAVSIGMGGSGWSICDVGAVVRIAKIIEQLPNIDELCDRIGRLTDAEVRKERKRIRETVRYSERIPSVSSKEEIVGVGFGRSMEDVLPQELALLSDGESEILFDLKYVEGRLMCFEKHGYLNDRKTKDGEREVSEEKREQKGPMILCVDTSGSMSGLPETVAKSIALFLASRARNQGRSCYLINFGIQCETLELTGRWDLEKALDFLGGSWSGGTDVSKAVSAALSLMEHSQWKRADVVIVSDLQFPPLSGELQESVVTVKKGGCRFYGVCIGDSRAHRTDIIDELWNYDARDGSLSC